MESIIKKSIQHLNVQILIPYPFVYSACHCAVCINKNKAENGTKQTQFLLEKLFTIQKHNGLHKTQAKQFEKCVQELKKFDHKWLSQFVIISLDNLQSKTHLDQGQPKIFLERTTIILRSFSHTKLLQSSIKSEVSGQSF